VRCASRQAENDASDRHDNEMRQNTQGSKACLHARGELFLLPGIRGSHHFSAALLKSPQLGGVGAIIVSGQSAPVFPGANTKPAMSETFLCILVVTGEGHPPCEMETDRVRKPSPAHRGVEAVGSRAPPLTGDLRHRECGIYVAVGCRP